MVGHFVLLIYYILIFSVWPIKSEGNSTFKAQELVRETEYEYEYELNYLPRRLVGHYDDGQICHPCPCQVGSRWGRRSSLFG